MPWATSCREASHRRSWWSSPPSSPDTIWSPGFCWRCRCRRRPSPREPVATLRLAGTTTGEGRPAALTTGRYGTVQEWTSLLPRGVAILGSGGVMSIAKRCLLVVLLSAVALSARAELGEINVAQQYGVSFLPLLLMERDKLVEKHAEAEGLGEIKVTWV